MPRKILLRSNTLPYHVTARTNNRELFHCPLVRVWQVLTWQCYEMSVIYGARIHAFVLMPNHFHFLVSVPEYDLGQVMQQFMRSGTKTLNRISGRSGHVFGGRYHWTVVNSSVYFAHVLKYVYRNPVRAGLCNQVENFEYSTLQGLFGIGPLPFPLYYPFEQRGFDLISNDYQEMQSWLNVPFRTEHERAIRQALRRTQFEPSKAGWKRAPSELKSRLL